MYKHLIQLILTLSCIFLSRCNYILTVLSTSYSVNTPANLTITIRTSSTITALDIVLSNSFVISNPICSINATITSCNRIVPSTGTNLLVRFTYNFQNNTNYTLTFNITNPFYADSFSVQGYVGSTSFINSGSLVINPFSINCSMQSSSPVVNQLGNTTFNIGVNTLPAGTIGSISIQVNSQEIYPNLINSSPSCFSQNLQYSCSLGTVFGVQVLTVNSINVGVRANSTRLPLLINSIRNPPYNDTFENFIILIQDSQGKNIQTCTIQQPAPTVLQESPSFLIQGWGSLVGQTSNVLFLLNPFFTPLDGITIKLVYQSTLSITPKPPAQYTTSTNGSHSSLMITNATYSTQILSFNGTVQNPSSVIPLSMVSYILYGSNYFRQQKALASGLLSLQRQTATVAVTVNNPITLVQSLINVTITSPLRINNGIVINIDIAYGSFICSGLSLSSNFIQQTISILGCTETTLSIRSTNSISASSSFWFSAAYLTYTSVITNVLRVNISSLDGYSIMTGNSTVPIDISQPIFTATSSNTTYTASSNFTFVQANVTSLASNVVRTVTLVPPLYAKINDNSQIVSTGTNTIISSFNIDLGGNTATAVIRGKIQIMLKNVTNPAHYLGGRTWTIICNDTTSFNSSRSSVIHTPQYSPVTSTISVSLTNSTIQQLSNITLTIQPRLQYNLSVAPMVTVQFSASSINSIGSACPSCTLLTSTKFSVTYYSVVMRPVVEITNNKDPNNNRVDFSISIDGFVYETGFVVYSLNPLQYSFQSTFRGEFGNLGQLQVRITSQLSTPLTVTYTGTDAIFTSAQQCLQCTSTYLLITGIVGYFQAKDVIISGYSNGTLYAQGVLRVYYTCSDIIGCQMCETINSTFMCLRCFSKQYTINYLLNQGACLSVCPPETFQDGSQCSPCPSLCYRCDLTTCFQCVPGYYIYDSSCVQECPPSFIKNSTHCLPRPIICPQNCVGCPADNQCTKCDSNYYLLENLCYTTCPKNYIINEETSTCKLFIPPKQTNYFPFAFFIASVIIMILLGVIKFFERRSLIIGNSIAITSFLEIGAIIMIFSYTFISMRDQPDIWSANYKLIVQAMVFLILLTKGILNLVFLAYFLRKISKDQNFQQWKSKSEQNNNLYLVSLIMSSIFSFQIMRIIYCRFLGLQIFFGRFNTSLIFKPLNFFSLAYIFPGGGLIVMAAFNIMIQGIYRTSLYYSSIQVILIEILIFGCCIIQAFRGDKEFFDYQLYKVQNFSQNSNQASKVKIMQQEQFGGTVKKLISKDSSQSKGPIGLDPDQVGNQTAGKIIRNKFWRLKKNKPPGTTGSLGSPGAPGAEAYQISGQSYEQIIQQMNQLDSQDNQIIEQNKTQNHNGNSQLKLSSIIGLNQKKNKQKSIFRRKIMQDWQKLKNKLPKVTPQSVFVKSSSKINLSKSPDAKKSPNKLKKINSLQKIQKISLKSPLPQFKNKSQLKNHFYRINKQKTFVSKQLQGGKQQDEKAKVSIDVSEDKTLAINNDNDNERNLENQLYNNGDFGNGADEAFQNQLYQKQQDISEIVNNQNQQSFEKSLIELRKNIKANRYDDFGNQVIHQDDQQKDQPSKNRVSEGKHDSFAANKRKIKKRNINKQTQAVYLQRLVSSSEMHRPKPVRKQKLQDF